jgi:transcription elongation factor/antiterminator RfaH
LETETTSRQLRWYAVYTKTGEEERAERNLQAWRIETFTPKIRERRSDGNAGKPSSVVKPLFPRYLFARFDLGESLHKVCFTRGVHSVVSFGGRPSHVADEVVELIKSQRGEDSLVRVGEEFRAGDRVMINSGPLKNFVGVFEGAKRDRDRVSILLSAMSYQSHILIERDALKKIAAQAAA